MAEIARAQYSIMQAAQPAPQRAPAPAPAPAPQPQVQPGVLDPATQSWLQALPAFAQAPVYLEITKHQQAKLDGDAAKVEEHRMRALALADQAHQIVRDQMAQQQAAQQPVQRAPAQPQQRQPPPRPRQPQPQPTAPRPQLSSGSANLAAAAAAANAVKAPPPLDLPWISWLGAVHRSLANLGPQLVAAGIESPRVRRSFAELR